MKLMAICFLFVLPAKSDEIEFVEGCDFLNASIEPYVLVSNDATKVELDFHERLMAEEKRSANIGLTFNARSTAGHKRVLSSWHEIRAPLQQDGNQNHSTRDEPYALLPNSVSLSNVKKRLSEYFFRVECRKEKSGFY